MTSVQIDRDGDGTLDRPLYNGWQVGRPRLGKGLLASAAEFMARIRLGRRTSACAGYQGSGKHHGKSELLN